MTEPHWLATFKAVYVGDPRSPNVLAAFITAHAGDPGPQAEMLREAGFEELADALETGHLVFQPAKIPENQQRLLWAVTECVKRGLDGRACEDKNKRLKPEVEAIARRHGAGAIALHNMLRQRGGTYRKLKHLG